MRGGFVFSGALGPFQKPFVLGCPDVGHYVSHEETHCLSLKEKEEISLILEPLIKVKDLSLVSKLIHTSVVLLTYREEEKGNDKNAKACFAATVEVTHRSSISARVKHGGCDCLRLRAGITCK